MSGSGIFEVYKFNEAEILLFVLALVRISSLLVVLPIFGHKQVPVPVKILLSLVITMVIFPSVRSSMPVVSGWKDDFIVYALREAFVGITLGYLGRLTFMAVEVAGQILGFSLGFNTGQLLNPASGESGNVLDQFYVILAMLLFLAIDGHHQFFVALYKSFQVAPLAKMTINPLAMQSVSHVISEVFVIGVKLSAPMMAVILFSNMAMGIIGRAVPQVNVFIVSFSVNVIVGLAVLIVSVPLTLAVMQQDFGNITGEMFKFLKGF